MAPHLAENDVMQRLAQYRPDATDSEWGATVRDAALAAALTDNAVTRFRPTPAHRRRLWGAALGGVAAVAAAALLIELVPSSNQRAQGGGSPGSTGPSVTSPVTQAAPSTPVGPDDPIARLADAARHTSLPNPSPGEYWYQRVELYQQTKNGHRRHIEDDINWVAPSGDDWHVDVLVGQHRSCTMYKYVGTPNPNHVNATYLRALPTERAALYRYLKRHVTGSSSRVEAVFVAIGDELRNDEGLVPPDLRAGFVEVLAGLPGVRVRQINYGNGRTATSFALPKNEPIVFDNKTAQVIYAADVPTYRVVSKLPMKVANPHTCPRGDN